MKEYLYKIRYWLIRKLANGDTIIINAKIESGCILIQAKKHFYIDSCRIKGDGSNAGITIEKEARDGKKQ